MRYMRPSNPIQLDTSEVEVSHSFRKIPTNISEPMRLVVEAYLGEDVHNKLDWWWRHDGYHVELFRSAEADNWQSIANGTGPNLDAAFALALNELTQEKAAERNLVEHIAVIMKRKSLETELNPDPFFLELTFRSTQ